MALVDYLSSDKKKIRKKKKKIKLKIEQFVYITYLLLFVLVACFVFRFYVNVERWHEGPIVVGLVFSIS